MDGGINPARAKQCLRLQFSMSSNLTPTRRLGSGERDPNRPSGIGGHESHRQKLASFRQNRMDHTIDAALNRTRVKCINTDIFRLTTAPVLH